MLIIPPSLPLYALPSEVAPLEADLNRLDGTERLDALVALAWHLRQRDTGQALTLAGYAAQLNQTGDGTPLLNENRSARLALVRAEAAILNGDKTLAESQLAIATSLFEKLGDPVGAGDTCLVAALHALAEADQAAALAHCKMALPHFQATDDHVRREAASLWVELLQARRSLGRPVADQESTSADMPPRSVSFDVKQAESRHPALAALALLIEGYRRQTDKEPADSISALGLASARAADAGLIDLAVAAATAAAALCLEHDDFEGASSWCKKSYALARPTGWPGALAACHLVFADLLHRIGDLPRSQAVYTEAMPLCGGRTYQCQWGLARSFLDLGSTDAALSLLSSAVQGAKAVGDLAAVCGAQVDIGRGLVKLGQLSAAVDMLEGVRKQAVRMGITTHDALLHELTADLYLQAPDVMSAPAGMSPVQAHLHFLDLALAASEGRAARKPPAMLLVKLARAKSANGDLAAAIQLYERSVILGGKSEARQVRDSLAAEHAQQIIEHARWEVEEQQRLVRQESTRAIELQAALDTMQEEQKTLARRTEELERLSMLDALTGIPSRRHLDERVMAEMALMKRKSSLLALVLFDLDHFKMVNDTYGHAAGDIVLKAVAETAKSLLRPSDFIARIGGEEFTLLLPRTNLQGAATISDRIRESLMALNIVYAEFRIPVTASFGVTLLDESENDITEAMNRADTALYRAKRDGRNMVRIEAV